MPYAPGPRAPAPRGFCHGVMPTSLLCHLQPATASPILGTRSWGPEVSGRLFPWGLAFLFPGLLPVPG